MGVMTNVRLSEEDREFLSTLGCGTISEAVRTCITYRREHPPVAPVFEQPIVLQADVVAEFLEELAEEPEPVEQPNDNEEYERFKAQAIEEAARLCEHKWRDRGGRCLTPGCGDVR